MPSEASPSRAKVQAYRARLRAQGLRPVQLWLPDTRNPVFREEARRQSRLVAESPQAQEDQDFVDAVADPSLWGFGG